MLLIAGATQKELARHVRYLKIENQILRGKLGQVVRVSPQERNRLIRYAAKLGGALNQLCTIVHPDTLRRWIRESRVKRKLAKAKGGRRRTKDQIRRLILKLAKENNWGYTRILGELKKLGITSVSRNTVKNILKENGFDPGPKRGVGTWDEFLKLHAATLWQCDYFSKKVLTIKGFRDAFVLVFLHVGTRRAFVTPASFNPNREWAEQQAKAFVAHIKQTGLSAEIVMRDRDGKFTSPFDETLKAAGLKIRKSAPRSPNIQAFVERFIQTLQQECLDYFIPIGRQHLDHLAAEAMIHYHDERPHQSLDNGLLAPLPKPKSRRKAKAKPPDETTIALSEVRCKQRLGGLLKHYYRQAA
ncbi:MAG: integrase core domain-containing protein [Pirellulales bacterium]